MILDFAIKLFSILQDIRGKASKNSLDQNSFNSLSPLTQKEMDDKKKDKSRKDTKKNKGIRKVKKEIKKLKKEIGKKKGFKWD